MKWLLYDLLFGVAYAALLPSFLWRMKRRGGYRARMGDRFGRYPKDLVWPECPVWIHAVSVGEVAVAGQLMRALRERDPAIRFVFSTTSSTGWAQAGKELAPGDALIYNPLDFSPCVRRALDRVRPRAVILTESEIWPTFIRALKRRHVPVYLVNARVSDRSAPRYRAARWWFGEVLRAFEGIFAQSDQDARRLIAAGAEAKTICVTGSFKFDVAHANAAKTAELSAWIRAGETGAGDGLLPGFVMPKADSPQVPPVLLGASTWPGEDEVLLRIYRELVRLHPEVRLVLVPRHFEKADAVEENILRAGFACCRRSTGRHTGSRTARSVYLGDTTGEMMGFFGLATVAFVGKSMCAHGSQNMIEPCLLGVPTLVGPYTENFRPVMSDLLSANALLQVKDEDALRAAVLALFADPASRAALGARAAAAVARRQGVVGRCADDLCARFHRADAVSCAAPAGVNRKGRRFWGGVVAAALAIYAVAGILLTPRIRHGWTYWQENATRRFSSYVTLAAASCAFPWCWCDGRLAYIRLKTRDLGFAKGTPYKVERQNGHVFAYYRDEDYGGDVVTCDGWPVVTGTRFKATRLLADLIPLAEGAARVAAPAAAEGEGDPAAALERAAAERRPIAARHIDARLMSMARMKGVLQECRAAFGAFKFWCIGRYDYLVTPACTVAADRLMALFDDPKTFERFAEAGVYSAADLYAAYVGTDREVLPAFDALPAYGAVRGCVTAPRLACQPAPEGPLEPVRPARLTPYYIVSPAHLVPGRAEPDLYASLTGRLEVVAAARRDLIMGLDAAERGSATNALKYWTQAAQRNPRDPLLRGLADALDLEGRRRLRVGDVRGALNCYERRILVQPHDVAAVHNFGVCLKKAGQMEMAAKVFLKAVTMDPRTDAHRFQFVECAAASGHEDAASRQMEVLLAHRPGDPYLKLRAARLLARPQNAARNETRAVKLAEEAVAATKWRKRDLVLGLADVYIEAGRVMMGLGLKKRMREMKFEE